jgi:prepilin-type N-terminal cleavage/methylation domain-containing protein
VTRAHSESGFSLIELMVAMGVLLVVSSIVTTALLQMTNAQTTIWNRTEMHSGIRGATELLQQEVGQAGRVTLPGIITLGEAIDVFGGVAPAAAEACVAYTPLLDAVPVQVLTDNTDGFAAVYGMWAVTGPPSSYIALTTLDGDNTETIIVGSTTWPSTITACFTKPHAIGTVLAPMGGFASGIVPPEPPDATVTPPYPGYLNGSTATKLKLFGDINGDGVMTYVEYTCDTTVAKLYRQVIPLDRKDPLEPFAVKGAPTDEEILLNNVLDNPGGTDCFKYQITSMLVQGSLATFVLDVAITLTVQTEQIDPVTRQYQTETKALLNVSPRNVFNAWSLASIGYTDRIQSTPVRVTTLLP